MSKREKLISRILLLDKNLRFNEVSKVLRHFGYSASFPNGGSSHCTFRKSGVYPITVPTHEPIPVEYVELVKEVILREREEVDDNE